MASAALLLAHRCALRSRKLPSLDSEAHLISSVGGNAEVHVDQPSEALAVLYVEDDSDSVLLFQRAIGRHEGIDLLVADSGRAALALAHRRHADVAFVDLHLPDMSGSAFVKRLRDEEPGSEGTIIFLLSAENVDVLEEQRVKIGADGCLPKPIDLKRLGSILNDIRDRKLPSHGAT